MKIPVQNIPSLQTRPDLVIRHLNKNKKNKDKSALSFKEYFLNKFRNKPSTPNLTHSIKMDSQTSTPILSTMDEKGKTKTDIYDFKTTKIVNGKKLVVWG